jgi:hypothetical protein
MKHSKKIGVTVLFGLALSLTGFGQELLPEVRMVALNYKYLKSVTDTNAAEPVKLLQRRAATYDVKSSEFYEDDAEGYFISFYIPAGRILAFYDQNGKMVRSVEKFKNVVVPKAVREAVNQRFPRWSISEDVYLVKFVDTPDDSKVYKLLLENGNKRIRVKTNEKGEFLK